jgi:glyoxylase-like metal-dependent hydrolase (beta-lactamase superfamily II)
VLVDAGIGDKLAPKEMQIYGVDRSAETLDRSLAAVGCTARDIDIVLASHLHFDHAGGFTSLVDGVLGPRFPRARYWIRRGEWEDAIHPNESRRPRSSTSSRAMVRSCRG